MVASYLCKRREPNFESGRHGNFTKHGRVHNGASDVVTSNV